MPEPVIFVAGGSGLSSPKSMILDLLEAGDTRAITLLYGARNREELYYFDLFTELAAAELDRLALDPQVIHDTLGVLLKYQDDIARVQGSEAARILSEVKAEVAAR